MSWELTSLADTKRALASWRQWKACVYAESTQLKYKFLSRKTVPSEKPKKPAPPPSLYSHDLHFTIDRRENVQLLHDLFHAKMRGEEAEASEEGAEEPPSAPRPAVRCLARFFAALAPREDPRDLFESTCSRLVRVSSEVTSAKTEILAELVSLERGFRVIFKRSRDVETLIDLLGDTPSYYFFVQQREGDPPMLNFLLRLRLATHPVALSSPLAAAYDEGEAAPSNPVCPGEATDFLAELDILVRLLTFVRAEDTLLGFEAIEPTEVDRRIAEEVRDRARILASAWSEDSSALFMKELDNCLSRLEAKKSFDH